MGPEISPELGGREGQKGSRPTLVTGINIRTEQNIPLDIPLENIRTLKGLAEEYLTTYDKGNQAEKTQKELKAEILNIIDKFPLLRGIELRDEKRGLNFVPTHTVNWQIDSLKDALGVLYSRIVTEEARLELRLPTGGVETTTGVIKTQELVAELYQSLRNKGVNEEDIKKLLKLEIRPKVDEEELQKVIADGTITLPENTRQEKITWVIRPFTIH